MRKLLVALGSITFLTVAGFALVWLLVDVNQFRPAIQADLQKQLHRPVRTRSLPLAARWSRQNRFVSARRC